ncbi:MAG: terminase gpA endonuclease subunit, partial [Pseudomonadota bacterium]
FVNTQLAEVWEQDAESVDHHALENRVEEWELPPKPILVVTAGVDVQDDRVEVEKVGWALGEESWSIEHKIKYGDPSGSELWKELDEYLLEMFEVEGRGQVATSATCVDTGGHYTQAAYAFCKPRFRRRVYAIKGIGEAGRPVWPKRASKNNSGGVNLFLVGVNAAKDMIFSRLKLDKPGPGYCHFPVGRDGEYFRQMTAEKVVTHYVKGFPTRIYQKDPSVRNEALDLRVYAYAALQALNVNWGLLAKHMEQRAETSRPEPQPRRSQPQTPAAQQANTGRRVIKSNFMQR